MANRRSDPRRSRLFLGLLLLGLAGCNPAWKAPEPIEAVPFLERAVSETRDGLTVTVGVPGRAETTRLFGTSLYNDRIQPVWIEVRNDTGQSYLLVKPGTDEDLFSPLEAAYQRKSGSKETQREMAVFFYRSSFHNPVPPGETRSGYLFTNLDEGFKAVNVDLVSTDEVASFTFVVQVPGLITDVDQVDLDAIWPEKFDFTEPGELRSALESLPCCTTNKKGDRNGDPLNIVFVGDRKDIFSALIRRGWHQTEVTYAASAWKTVKSFLFGSRYRYSPISPLYVYGRPQDMGAQKARGSVHLRNHMRVWQTPYRYRGDEVYIGQISRDIGVKLNWPTITTHAIDPDVDDTRDVLVGDLAYSQSLQAIAYVKGSQPSTMEDTHYNLTPDPYFSDGLRAVLFFGERPTGLNEIRFLDWEPNAKLEIEGP